MSFIMPKVNPLQINNDYMYDVISELMDSSGYLVVKPESQSRNFVKYYHYIILKLLYKDKRFKTPIPRAWYMPHISPQAFQSFESYSELFTQSVQDMIEKNVFYQENIMSKYVPSVPKPYAVIARHCLSKEDDFIVLEYCETIESAMSYIRHLRIKDSDFKYEVAKWI